jgi:hypothetical protein
MKRREFITLLARRRGRAARAQQQPVRPLIGFLSPLSAALHDVGCVAWAMRSNGRSVTAGARSRQNLVRAS